MLKTNTHKKYYVGSKQACLGLAIGIVLEIPLSDEVVTVNTEQNGKKLDGIDLYLSSDYEKVWNGPL